MIRILPLLVSVMVCGWLVPTASRCEANKAESPPDAAKQVTEITLERGGGGKGPQDTLTLRKDGTAIYVGTANVGRIGRYKGTIAEHGFHDNFPLLAEAYAALRGQPASKGKPTGGRVTPVAIRVVWDGKREEITDLCPGMDKRLWSFEMAARGIAADIKWQKDEAKKP
jgi:hypothetical protein